MSLCTSAGVVLRACSNTTKILQILQVCSRASPPGGVGWVGAPQNGTFWVLGGYFSKAGGVDFSGGVFGGRILVKLRFSGG